MITQRYMLDALKEIKMVRGLKSRDFARTNNLEMFVRLGSKNIISSTIGSVLYIIIANTEYFIFFLENILKAKSAAANWPQV